MTLDANKKNVLVLAPHTDDGELGAGGSIARFIEEGRQVFYVAFSTAEQSLPEGLPPDALVKEVRKATHVLGIPEENLIVFNYEVRKLSYMRQEILEAMVSLKNKLEIDLVLMPSLKDIHQDHTTIAHEALRAFKNYSILGYELIWNNLSFDTTCFVTLDAAHVSKKANALRKYYSQQERNYMTEEFVFSQAKTRGVQIGSDYAEAFEVVRWII